MQQVFFSSSFYIVFFITVGYFFLKLHAINAVRWILDTLAAKVYKVPEWGWVRVGRGKWRGEGRAGVGVDELRRCRQGIGKGRERCLPST